MAAAPEIGLLYYVICEPEHYLNHRISKSAPFVVWLYPPVIITLLLFGIKEAATTLRSKMTNEN
jgi:hypothetical protein